MGSVPILFIVFMNDFVKELPTFCAMNEYDIVVWGTEEYAATGQIWLQTAINVLTNKWYVKMKTETNLHYRIYTFDQRKAC